MLCVVNHTYCPDFNIRQPGRDFNILHMAPFKVKAAAVSLDFSRFSFHLRCLLHFHLI